MSELIEITQYKIVCKDENVNFIYNGHTKNYYRRVISHKSDCNNPNSEKYNIKLYQKIRENGGIGNFEFIILETQYVKDIQQARETENFWFNTLQSNMNSRFPKRIKFYYTSSTQKEYQQTEQYKKYKKEYQQTEQYKKYHKDYHKIKMTCECGSIVSQGNYSRHQQSKKHLDFIN
jgi:hypothetical protein